MPHRRQLRAFTPRFDRPPGLSHDEALLEDVRLSILAGTYISDDIDDEDLPVAGRIERIAHTETLQ